VDPGQFFAASRVVIVAGKGGVGKTTVSAALARAAALAGATTLVIEVEGKSGLPAMFGQPDLSYDEVVLAAGGGPDGAADVRARNLTADDALLEYLADHGLRRVSKRLVSSGALDVVATAAPGIRDILLLGKVKQLERSETADLIVLDAPAAGHAITFLQSARALLDTVRVGPINAQARDVLELLTDPARCQVLLVTLPEETPVNELVDTAYQLEDRVGVSLGPVVVNGLYPVVDGLDAPPEEAARAAGATLAGGEAEALQAAAAFRTGRMALQDEQLARLDEKLPLPQIRLPYLFDADLGPAQVDLLAAAFTSAVEELDPARLGHVSASGVEISGAEASGGEAETAEPA
jgi:anion-transporting  ArsA/GET3 family ATPase